MKKITDKQRLDWLVKNFVAVNSQNIKGKNVYWITGTWNGVSRTYRQAIDSVIKAERKAKAEVSK